MCTSTFMLEEENGGSGQRHEVYLGRNIFPLYLDNIDTFTMINAIFFHLTFLSALEIFIWGERNSFE